MSTANLTLFLLRFSCRKRAVKFDNYFTGIPWNAQLS